MAGENQGVNGVTEIWKYGSVSMVFCQKHRSCDNLAEIGLLMEQAKLTLIQYSS